MEVDPRAPVCESAELFIGARPEVVWDTLSDLRSWPRWMPGVKAMRVDEPLGVGTAFRWKAGPGTIHSEILDCDRPRSIGWKGRTFGIAALHVWRMTAEGAGTKVHTEESWAGPLPRLLRRTSTKTVKKALREGMPALREEAEARSQPMS